jgi:hypothetical protein
MDQVHQKVNSQIPDVPVALFICGYHRLQVLPRIATNAGFRSIQVPWYSCESLKDGVLIEPEHYTASDAEFSGSRSVEFIRPSVVIPLTTRPGAVRLITDLALRSNAFVGNLSILGNIRATALDRCIALGLATFTPTEALALDAISMAGGQESGPGMQGKYMSKGTHRKEVRSQFIALLQEWAKQREISSHDLLHLVAAPCALVVDKDTLLLADPLTLSEHEKNRDAKWCQLARIWFDQILKRVSPLVPAVFPSELRLVDDRTQAPLFPTLFDTPQFINTVSTSSSEFVYLHEDLQPIAPTSISDRTQHLAEILCRQRASDMDETDDGKLDPRMVEPGVGRTFLCDGIQVPSLTEFHDYTVLGIGLTQYSQGGYVQVGREIDGKASLVRAWHRKRCADRLETSGCRAGRVVAIVQLDGDGIKMPDGTTSPPALIVRGFRSVYRVKQLDPLICCLHSIQHTPIIYDYLLHYMREWDGLYLNSLEYDERLAQELEAQLASQESLRLLLDESMNSATTVQRIRLRIIRNYAPLLINIVKNRLAQELGVSDGQIGDSQYLGWFSEVLGGQLRTWRYLRFLHDYHHPGVSRWSYAHPYSLVENNVTLLAEFPDLDTGVFVDDEYKDINGYLQLGKEDVDVLRGNYQLFHERDAKAAATVVRSLSGLLAQDPPAIESYLQRFWRAYAAD